MFDMLTANTISPANRSRLLTALLLFIAAIIVTAHTTQAQTTTFTYQGRLTDSGSPASGMHDFEFKLYDASGAQVGAALTVDDVLVTGGLFTVQLDFGVSPFASATATTLEIGVRPGASTGAFTVLAPRQPITSSPYAIKTLNAAQLGGVASDQFVQTTDPRLSDARPPAPGNSNYIQNQTSSAQAAAFNISGDGVIGGNVGIGTTTPTFRLDVKGEDAFGNTTARITSSLQAAILSLDSTISGQNQIWNVESGVLGNPGLFGILNRNTLQAPFTIDPSGNVGIGTTSPAFKLDIKGQDVIGNAVARIQSPVQTAILSLDSTIGGTNQIWNLESGVHGIPGLFSIFDRTAFQSRLSIDTTGRVSIPGNLDVGQTLNADALTGNFTIPATRITGALAVVNGGTGLGSAGPAGNFLRSDGTVWTSSPIQVSDIPDLSSSFIQNTTTQQSASNFNVSGTGTATIFNAATQFNIGGQRALSATGPGLGNTSVGLEAGSNGTDNVFVGFRAGLSNSQGSSNSFLGSESGLSNTTGSGNTFAGTASGKFNGAGGNNSFYGALAGFSNTSGNDNTFVGVAAGQSNGGGNNNSFFGRRAGMANTASDNSFFGSSAGLSNTTGDRNAFFGISAGENNTAGCCNSFFGNKAGLDNTIGRSNSFFGGSAGRANTIGSFNSFFGDVAGINLSAGTDNTFVGYFSGKAVTTGTSNTLIGSNTTGADNLTNATAVGANAFVSQNNSLVLGSISGVNGATSDTNVGIGTSAPGSKLTVAGLIETTNGGVKFPDGTIQTTAASAGSITDITAGAGLTGGGTTGNLTLDVGAGPGINVAADMISIADAGVTTAKLADASVSASKIAAGQVVKSVTVGTSTLRDDLTLAAGPGIALTPAGNTVTIAATGGGGGLPAPGSPNYIQNTTTTQAGANFTIDGSGTVGGTLSAANVGIGTTTPQTRLHVEGAGFVESMVRSTNERAILSLDSNAGGQRRIWTLESGVLGLPNRFGIYDRTANQARLVITETGNVGIGALVPLFKLTVQGGIAAGNSFFGDVSVESLRVRSLGTAGNSHLCRNAQNLVAPCSSSLRYKTDLQPFSDSLKFINQLRPISFRWKSDGALDVGFGAEDIAKVNPLFVTYNDRGQVEGVKYDRLSVVFVNAFKEQQAQIERQQQQIDDLKKVVCLTHPAADVCKQ